jgi:hypothetical protein
VVLQTHQERQYLTPRTLSDQYGALTTT